MAVGDDALAAGMTLVLGTAPANTLETIINGVLDEIARRTSAVMPVAKGGTGATNAAGARTNLDVPSTAQTVTNGDTANPIRLTRTGDRARLRITGVDKGDIALVPDVDGAHANANGRVSRSGDTMSGDLYLPGASPAVSSYTIAYINGDGRVSKGASSERYKKYIRALDPAELGNIFPDLHRFQMRSLDGTGDGRWILGYIAERLEENEEQRRFVVYDAAGRPDSIDFIQLLIAQVAQLHQREQELEMWVRDLLQRVAVLEDAR